MAASPAVAGEAFVLALAVPVFFAAVDFTPVFGAADFAAVVFFESIFPTRIFVIAYIIAFFLTFRHWSNGIIKRSPCPQAVLAYFARVLKSARPSRIAAVISKERSSRLSKLSFIV